MAKKHYYFKPIYDWRPIWKEEERRSQILDTKSIFSFSDMMHLRQQQLKRRILPYCKIQKNHRGITLAYDGLGAV